MAIGHYVVVNIQLLPDSQPGAALAGRGHGLYRGEPIEAWSVTIRRGGAWEGA